MRLRTSIAFLSATMALVAPMVRAQTPPVPRPFPGAGAPPTTVQPAPPPQAPPPSVSTPPAAPPPATAAVSAPGPTGDAPPAPAGVPIYPNAEYIATFDAGAGQEYVLYGSQLPYAEMVAYYKTALRNGGREVFKPPMPPTYQFDLGRFNEDRMAFPPSVVVRDYTWNNSPGYLHVAGTSEKRYKTVIQIVAPGPPQ